MQRPTVMASRDLRIGCASLLQRVFSGERDDAMEFRIEALQSAKINLCQLRRSQLAAFNPPRKLPHWSEGNCIFASRQRKPRVAATDETIAILRELRNARQHWIPLCCWRQARFQCDLARTSAVLVK